MAITGDVRSLSLIVAGSFIQAEFGNESAAGVGAPEAEVCQSVVSLLIALDAPQPAGNAGTVTPSKFSKKVWVGFEQIGDGVALGVGLAVAVAVGVAVAVAVAVPVAVPVGDGEALGQPVPKV